MSRTNCDRLNQAIDRKYRDSLQKVISQANNRAVCPLVASKVESELIKDRIKFSANRRCWFDKAALKGVLTRVS